MYRQFTVAILVWMSFAWPSSGTIAAQAECDGLMGYFAEVDRRLGEGFIPLFQDEAFVEQMTKSTTKANRSDMSILVLSPTEMEPFIQLMSVPGDVLISLDNSVIPSVAKDLHDSALEIWLLMPAMMRSVATGGIFGALPFSEEIESLEAENLQAQESLVLRCPIEVAEYKTLSEGASRLEDTLGAEDLSDLSALTPEVFEGASFELLFFASDDEGSGELPIPGLPGSEEATPEPD